MNEFTARKLGEVLAFTTVALESLSKGRNAFGAALGEEKLGDFESQMKTQKDSVENIADRAHMLPVVMKKLEATGEKLRQMRDLYVGEEWENPVELMEWSGFFEGAAIVHWSLVKGAADSIGHNELKALANIGLDIHKMIFDHATSYLEQAGSERASA